MAPRRTWPTTAQQRADRDRVFRLVRRVGMRQLRFTIADLRRAAEDLPACQLHEPSQLSRHVQALIPMTLVSIGQPLAHLSAIGDDRAPSKSRHQYVLAHRIPEHEAAPPDYGDELRVYVALCVAAEANAVPAVETNAVTRVCKLIPELSVDPSVQMSTRLRGLVSRRRPLVAMHLPADGAPARWRRWAPVGAVPDDPRLARWVARVQDDAASVVAPSRVGHATVNDIMAELVQLAVASTVSPFWPHGHAVTAHHIAAVCATSSRARELSDLLQRRGVSRAQALGDVSRARIGGRRRVRPLVAKVGRIPGGRTHYDVPDRDVEARSLIVPYCTLKHALSHVALEALAAEWRAATRLKASGPPAIAAAGAVRVALVHARVAELEQQRDVLVAQGHLFSEQARKRVQALGAELEVVRRRIGSADDAREDADRLLRPLGLDLDMVMASPRPILLGEQFKAWMPLHRQRGRSGPQLLSDLTTLPRIANPTHTHRADTDPLRSASTGMDRVDALRLLAEKLGARTLSFLQRGADLLGRDLRDARLPRALLTSSDERQWVQGLAALALLGDPAAQDAALATLRDAEHAPSRAIAALYALTVLRAPAVEQWPSWLQTSRSPQVVQVARAVLAAPRTGEWLL